MANTQITTRLSGNGEASGEYRPTVTSSPESWRGTMGLLLFYFTSLKVPLQPTMIQNQSLLYGCNTWWWKKSIYEPLPLLTKLTLNKIWFVIYECPWLQPTSSPDTNHDMCVAGVVDECQGKVVVGFIFTENLWVLFNYQSASTSKTLKVNSSLLFCVLWWYFFLFFLQLHWYSHLLQRGCDLELKTESPS